MDELRPRNGRALIVTPDMSNNSTGRSYVTWLLLRALGWECAVVAVAQDEDHVWAPLEGTPFADSCSMITGGSQSDREDRLAELLDDYEVLVCTKALPASFGVLMPIAARKGRRVVLDFDDPDLESYFPSKVPAVRLAMRYARHPSNTYKYLRCYYLMRRWSHLIGLVVSNPVLGRDHGGVVIPHLREDLGGGSSHISSDIVVGFIGTNRDHKGVNDLRAAARLAGVELVVTDSEPSDGTVNERWVGTMPYSQTMELIRQLDVVVVPSKDSLFARGQLPAKLMDGMFAGRMIIASDLPPVRWALQGTGALFPPGDVYALADALVAAKDPAIRATKGAAARRRALQEFTVAANLDRARSVFGVPMGSDVSIVGD